MRLSSAGDIEKTTWGCVLEGFATDQKRTPSPVLANAWKPRRSESPPTPTCGRRLLVSSRCKESKGGDRRRKRGERRKARPSRGSTIAGGPAAPAISRPWIAALSSTPLRDTTPHANRSAFWLRRKKWLSSIPTMPTCWEAWGCGLPLAGHWDEGTALAEKGPQIGGASPPFHTGGGRRRSRAWFRGEYQKAYEDFQRAYIRSFSLSHPRSRLHPAAFLGRVDEAKQHVAALLKMYPTMTIREADAFYRLVCFDAPYREKMVRALRQAGLPE